MVRLALCKLWLIILLYVFVFGQVNVALKKKKKSQVLKKKKHLFSLKIFRVTEPKKINRHYELFMLR